MLENEKEVRRAEPYSRIDCDHESSIQLERNPSFGGCFERTSRSVFFSKSERGC